MLNYRANTGKTIVRFTQSCVCWNPPDLAGFTPEAAAELVARDIAVYWQPPDDKTKAIPEQESATSTPAAPVVAAADNNPTLDEAQAALKGEAVAETPKRKKRSYRRKSS